MSGERLSAEKAQARCPGCGHTCCPYPGLECGGDSDAVQACERAVSCDVCTTHYDPPQSEFGQITLTDDERTAISAVVHQNYYMPDVFAAVERIVEARLSGPGLAVQYQSPNGTSLTRCCCDRTTARLVVCPVHPEAHVLPPGQADPS